MALEIDITPLKERYPHAEPAGLNVLDPDFGNAVCTLEPPENGSRLVCKAGLLTLDRIQPDKDHFKAIGFTESKPGSCQNCIVYQRAHGIGSSSQPAVGENPVSSAVDAYLRETL